MCKQSKTCQTHSEVPLSSEVECVPFEWYAPIIVCYPIMKPKVIIPILAVICLGLIIGIIVSRRTIGEQVEKITYHSNEWMKASVQVSDLTKVNDTLKEDLTKKNVEFVGLSNTYTEVRTTLQKTEADLKQTEDSLKMTKEQVAARDAQIAGLEAKNHELDVKSAELSDAITNLNTQITATKARLTASEGDKALLQKELTTLLAQKAELERQLNDLQFLKKQVAQLKAELSISKRLEWIRQGLFAPGEHKGASQLMNPSAPKQPKQDNYDLNVEIKSDGSVKVIPGVTNAPVQK